MSIKKSVELLFKSLNYRKLNQHSSGIPIRFLTSVSLTNNHEEQWGKAIHAAEELVGNPNSHLKLQSLFADEKSQVGIHVSKLVGTSHPLGTMAKEFKGNKKNLQFRGLLVMLISRMLLSSAYGSKEKLSKQQNLAEITDMIHAAHLIHQVVVNPTTVSATSCLEDLEYGNKIAILSGDYLLAHACTELAALNNTEVVELIGSSIGDFMESQFIGNRDDEGTQIPSKDFSVKDWENKTYLSVGSLIAKSCRSSAMLVGASDKIQDHCYHIGKHVGLCWQAYNESQSFFKRKTSKEAFDLTSLPWVIYMSKNPESFPCDAKNESYDFSELRSSIMNGNVIEECKTVCISYADEALAILKEFQQSDAQKALFNIISALKCL